MIEIVITIFARINLVISKPFQKVFRTKFIGTKGSAPVLIELYVQIKVELPTTNYQNVKIRDDQNNTLKNH